MRQICQRILKTLRQVCRPEVSRPEVKRVATWTGSRHRLLADRFSVNRSLVNRLSSIVSRQSFSCRELFVPRRLINGLTDENPPLSLECRDLTSPPCPRTIG